MEISALTQTFQAQFGRPATLRVEAPGRVNLIGEHTDYNEGFVFPAAIDRHIRFLVAPAAENRIRAYSVDFEQRSEFRLDEPIEKDRSASWINYLRGVAVQFLERGFSLGGVDLVVSGNVPIGAGLSSSAAFEVGAAEVFRVLGNLEIDRTEMALLAQAAENRFVGVQCGIMDQFVVALAEKDHALLIDCRDLSYSGVPLPPRLRLVVCDSRVQRRLDGSEYNSRRAQCEEAARRLAERVEAVKSLRDVDREGLEANRDLLSEVQYRRARHVVSENARVQALIGALQSEDLEETGRLLYESHRSLRDDYEVSCRELDLLVDLARRSPGIIGGRMTGAGFGGCTVNLVESACVDSFCDRVRAGYLEETGRECEIYICRASGGVASLPLA